MEEITSFSGFHIAPGERYRVSVPDASMWSLTSISILPEENTPETGRVVVYAEAPVADKEGLQTIAIAALRVGSQEIVNTDYSINSCSPMVFYTKGDPITVSISGASSIPDQTVIEKITEK